MTYFPYNPIERFNRAFILYEDLLAASQEQLTPTTETGYPMTNMDFRDPNVVVRVTGAGTAASPIQVKFDLGEVKILESIALADCNVNLDGGVAVELGIDDGDSTPPWDERQNIFHSQQNQISNPSFERFNAITSVDPSPGTVQADSWFIGAGSPFLRVLPYQTDVDGFPLPSDASNYVNQLYGKFVPSATLDSVACLSQWFLPNVGQRVKGSFWVSTKGVTYPTGVQVFFAELDAALTPLSLSGAWNDVGFSIAGWEQKTFDFSITSANTRYIAIVIQSSTGTPSGEALYIDHFRVMIGPKDRETFTSFIRPIVSGNLFKSFDHPVPARFVKLSFVNGSSIAPAPETFIQFGRILTGKTLVLGVQRGAGNTENSGDQIQLSTGGSPIETKVRGIDKRFNLEFKQFKVGEVDDILEILNPIQGDQIFLSMFHQNKRDRAMFGNITPPITAREATVKNFMDINMTFTKEGR